MNPLLRGWLAAFAILCACNKKVRDDAGPPPRSPVGVDAPPGEPAGGGPLGVLSLAQQREQIASLSAVASKEKWSFAMASNDVSRFPLARITGGIPDEPTGGSVVTPDRRVQKAAPPGKEGDAKLDWRSVKDVIGPVRDQGDCPSCWAFTADAMLESAHVIAKGGDASSSEQQLMDCVPHPGCHQNRLSEPAEYAVATGDAARADVPYTAAAHSCRTDAPVKYKGIETDLVAAAPTIADVKRAIVVVGPVGAFIIATNALKYYSGSGVFDEFASSGEGHLLLIVGWDDTKPHRKGKGAWLVKNSWGTTWGDKGFGWIAYDSNKIASSARWLRVE